MSLLLLAFKRSRAPIGIAALLIAASSVPAAAQFPYPPVHYVAPDASVKFDVKPKNAAVYVDGYFAGIVDDYDGTFQRLYTAPGGHEITLYLEGYRTYTERAYLAINRTFKIAHQMEKLPAGEVAERPPAPPPPPPDDEQAPPPGARGYYGRRVPPPSTAPAPADQQAAPEPEAKSSRGTLELILQPADADVLIDGQPWHGSGQERPTIDLPEGRHNIQVRKAGFVGYLTEVQIRNGETISLNVNLRAQPPR